MSSKCGFWRLTIEGKQEMVEIFSGKEGTGRQLSSIYYTLFYFSDRSVYVCMLPFSQRSLLYFSLHICSRPSVLKNQIFYILSFVQHHFSSLREHLIAQLYTDSCPQVSLGKGSGLGQEYNCLPSPCRDSNLPVRGGGGGLPQSLRCQGLISLICWVPESSRTGGLWDSEQHLL